MQLESASTNEELQDLLNSEQFSFRFDCGVCQPASSININDKQHLVSSIALHYCIYACKAELDEIRRGLVSLGFVGLMTQYPCLMSLFKASSQKLTADMLQNMFSHTFSLAGSNSRAKEQQIMMHILELLHDVEGMYGIIIMVRVFVLYMHSNN